MVFFEYFCTAETAPSVLSAFFTFLDVQKEKRNFLLMSGNVAVCIAVRRSPLS